MIFDGCCILVGVGIWFGGLVCLCDWLLFVVLVYIGDMLGMVWIGFMFIWLFLVSV